MRRTEKVGIAKLVMHDKSYLAALAPLDGWDDLPAHDALWAGSARRRKRRSCAARSKVNEREMKVAEQFIDSLESKFDPEQIQRRLRRMRFEDDREQIARAKKIVSQPPPSTEAAHAQDLMAALEASLAEANGASNGKRPRQWNGTELGMATAFTGEEKVAQMRNAPHRARSSSQAAARRAVPSRSSA